MRTIRLLLIGILAVLRCAAQNYGSGGWDDDRGHLTAIPRNLVLTQLRTPNAPAVSVTARDSVSRSTSYQYKIVAKLSDGTHSVASAGTSVNNGPLGFYERNTITWDKVEHSDSYDVYCTAGCSPTGKIASSVKDAYWQDRYGVGDGAAAPTTNTTGNFLAPGSLTVLGNINIGINTPAQASAQTANDKLAEIPSVKDYGAAGDGVTDDAAAIQTALTANAGGRVFFPAATYIVGAEIDVPNLTELYGIPYKSILKVKSSTTLKYVLRSALIDHQQNFEGWRLDGIEIDGGADRGSTIAEAVISCQKCFNASRFINLYTRQHNAPGIFIGPGQRTEGAGSVIIKDSWINPGTNSTGILVQSSYPTSVTGATNATPIVLTVAYNGLADGQAITVASVGGNTAANGSYYAKVSGYDSTHFALYSDAGLTTPVAGNGTYTSGGTATVYGRVQGITIDSVQVENTGTAPAVWMNGNDSEIVRLVTVSSLWCGNDGAGACVKISGTYDSHVSDVWDFTNTSSGQPAAVVIDNTTYNNGNRLDNIRVLGGVQRHPDIYRLQARSFR